MLTSTACLSTSATRMQTSDGEHQVTTSKPDLHRTLKICPRIQAGAWETVLR